MNTHTSTAKIIVQKEKNLEKALMCKICIRRDRQIPDLDTIVSIKFSGNISLDKEITEYFNRLTGSGIGIFLEDAFKLNSRELSNNKNFENYHKVFKSALVNYLEETGQEDRIKKYGDKLICRCFCIYESEIKALAKEKDGDLQAVKDSTFASQGCGSCKKLLEQIVTDFSS